MAIPLHSNIDLSSGARLVNVPTPVSPGDVANKAYVDSLSGGGGGEIASSNHVLSSNFTLGANKGAVVPRYVRVPAGIVLTLAAGSTLRIH